MGRSFWGFVSIHCGFMDLLGAIIRGAVQGITEFLPISSDGHLVVIGHYLGETGSGRDALGFDILLHAASLIAILVGFRDVWMALARGLIRGESAAWRQAAMIVVATVPGVIAGLFFADSVAGMRSLTAASVGFLVTASCLVGGEWIARYCRGRGESITVFDAVLIGIAQALAILPGVSRSGLTVSMGRALGLERSSALNLSFLMALPIIGGAVAKTALDAFDGEIVFPVLRVSIAGFASSLVVSLAAVVFLRRFALRNSFAWFAWYLVPLALLLLAEDMGLRTMLDAEHAREAVRSIGAAAVFFFAIIEVVPPFSFVSPGITAIVIAGSLAPDPLSLLVFALSAVAASLLGNSVLYALGRYAGPSLVRALRIPDDMRAKGEEFVRSSGMWAVIGGQFVGALRPTVAFAAGLLRMHPARFFMAAVIGAVVWGGSAVSAGYALQGNLVVIVSAVAAFGVLTVIVFAIVASLQWRRTRHDSSRS